MVKGFKPDLQAILTFLNIMQRSVSQGRPDSPHANLLLTLHLDSTNSFTSKFCHTIVINHRGTILQWQWFHQTTVTSDIHFSIIFSLRLSLSQQAAPFYVPLSFCSLANISTSQVYTVLNNHNLWSTYRLVEASSLTSKRTSFSLCYLLLCDGKDHCYKTWEIDNQNR